MALPECCCLAGAQVSSTGNASRFVLEVAGLSVLDALAVSFFMAGLMTQLFSNAGAALTGLPLALDTENGVGADTMAFALVAAFVARTSVCMLFSRHM